MQLEEFVAESLTQLARGIKAASVAVTEAGGVVNPSTREKPGGRDFNTRLGMVPVVEVEFDVAVSASGTEGSKAGLGVVVAAFALGGSTHETTTDEQVSRLRFTVPVVLPPGPRHLDLDAVE